MFERSSLFKADGDSYYVEFAHNEIQESFITSLSDKQQSLWDYDFLLTSSSGSTGAPKLIVFSQAVKYKRALSAITEWKLDKSDVILNASPIHHSLGQRLSILPLILGSTQVLLARFSIDSWIEMVGNFWSNFYNTCIAASNAVDN